MKLSALITVVLAALLVTPALAKDDKAQQAQPQPQRAEPESKLARADRLYREANELFRADKHALAVDKYKQALALKQTYDIAGNLAVAELVLKRYVDAAEHFALSLRIYPVNAAAAERAKTIRHLETVREHIVTVRIKAPAGATVMLGNRNLGTAPLEHEVYCEPGAHPIKAQLDGHATTNKSINAKAGEEITVELPKGAPLDTNTGTAERSYVPEIVLGAVGVAALVTGAVLYGVAVGGKNSAEEQRDALPGSRGFPCNLQSNAAACATLADEADKAYVLSGAGIGMLAVGSMALAAGVAHFAIVGTGDGSDEGSATLQASPMLGAVNGLQLRGTF